VEQKVEIEYAGLPMDYLERYLDIIRAITKADLVRVAERLLHPDRATVLVIGTPEAIDGFPEGFGAFQPATIEAAPAETAAPTANE